MNTRVFVVNSFDYDDCIILKVFSEEYRARDYIDSMNPVDEDGDINEDYNNPNYLYISEHVIE